MLFNTPGLWILASVIGAIGTAMQVRWIFTRPDVPPSRKNGLFISTPRRNGMLRAAAIELVGIVLLVLTAVSTNLIIGLAFIVMVGSAVGFIASRALQPPA